VKTIATGFVDRKMELHPLVFALLAYGLAAVIAVCVTFIVKIISYTVQRKKGAAEGTPEAEDKGGNAP
jgi:hypothetical protein